MPLRRLLTTDRVAVHSRARSTQDVLSELVELAVPQSASQSELLEALRAREAAFPTMLGDGVAMPHVRTPLVSEVCVAACVLDEPIAFGKAEGHPVDVLLLLLSPTNAPSEHLSVLRALTRLVADADVLFALRHANTAAEFVSVAMTTLSA